MKLKSLKLKDYRNYSYLDISFDEKINIFYGDNAQGKTNILESIYLCATSKSHKSSKDRDMIIFDKDESHIELILEKKGIDYSIDLHLKKNFSKGIAINKIPIKKASELLGVVNVVFFSPEDLNIIKNGPSERRRFMDMELAQLDKIYLNDLANYNKIVNQRNKLLKDSYSKNNIMDTLDIWDIQLIDYGNKVIKRREKFIEEVNQIIEGIHYKLSGKKEKIKLIYEKSNKNISLEECVERNRSKDLKMKNTSVGPHRDDIGFYINDLDIKKYGSQGQQRTAALSLKMAEIEIVKKLIKDSPILLLDDVLSELDHKRQNYLLESINNVQTLITCTGVEEFIKNRIEVNKVFYVENGIVSKDKNHY